MKSRTYMFVEKDPVCHEVMDMVDQAGLRGPKKTGLIATLATLAKATVDGLLYGDTKQPRNSTVMKIATALGFKRTFVRDVDNWSVEDELKAAKAWIKKQRKLMEEARPKKKKRVRKTARKPTKLRLVSSRAA